MRPLAAAVATALLVLPLAALTRLPYTPPGAGDAMLRLSWRSIVSGSERCRDRTPAELDALPVHMRTPQVCTTDPADYMLTVRVGGVSDTLRLLRGGVKGDRPLFVLEERRLPAGRESVAVGLLRQAPDGVSVLAALDTVLGFEAGRVRLVTLDPDGRLVVR